LLALSLSVLLLGQMFPAQGVVKSDSRNLRQLRWRPQGSSR